MIKAIIFDWGGVLIDNPSNDLMNYCSTSLNVDQNLLEKIFSSYKHAFQKDEITENTLWHKICSELHVKKPVSRSLWKDAIKNTFKNKQEIFDLISALKEQGYMIGFLSNTEIPAMEYFFENTYDTYFDVTTFSCAEKTRKPEEKIYTVTLEKLNVKPHEALFIDDKPHYIESAKKLGINGIVFENSDQLQEYLSSLSIRIN